ncbi:uncharacterized protein LOC123907281 [Trifolium pratense]|uniref:uncharacterized protein LOC123907281 n=1 Tax=Trifolium pratense TaxID=57577 RepID=UPI001E6902AD|nr:uncharacterized protein LOC123907281 [Trifolium pratense]
MAESEVCPTVDAIRAFLEHLVDPMLEEKPCISDDPSLSLQQKVAKQVHSVVLLYNYYHRKQNPELEFVAFKEFCKLIVDLRPALLPYMKFTQQPVEADLVDVEQQMSLTEKSIMSSYDICTLLDASKKVPNIEGWPISKVAVLLVDSKKENCFLLSRSITDGAWSLIEKDVDASNQISEATSEIKTYKKRRVIKKPSNDGLNEGQILRVGYSVAKEAAGVNTIDIFLLKSYTVYSHSKEKTASRFYIMKCSQPINEGFIQIPIKDLVERFQGPLVKRSSSSWKVTPVVECFHVLPYSEIISDWISRETFSNSLQDSKLEEKQFPKLEVTELHVSRDGTSIALDNKPCSDTIVALNQKENNGCSTIILRGSIKEDQDMDADNSSVFLSKDKEECQKHIAESLVSSDATSNGLDNKPCSDDTIVALNQEKNNACGTIIKFGSIKEDRDMDADNSFVFPSKDKEECQKHIGESNVSNDDMSIGLDNKPCSDTIVALNQKENNDCRTIIRCGSIKEDTDMDAGISLVLTFEDKEECQKHIAESHVSNDGKSVGLDNKPCSDTIVALNQKENNDCGTIIRCGSIKEDQNMDAGNSFVFPSEDKEECQKLIAESHVSNDGMSIGLDNKPCGDTVVALNQKENNDCGTIIRCGSIKEDQDMDAGNSLVFLSEDKEECQKHIAESHVSSDGMSIGLDNKPCSDDTIVALNQEENNACGTIIRCGSIKEDRDMGADNSLDFASKNKEECQKHIAQSNVTNDGMSIGLANQPCSDTIVALNQKENNDCGTILRCGSIEEDQDMDADNSLVFESKNKECQKHIAESLVSSDVMSNGLDSKPCSDDTIVALNQVENNACGTIIQCVSIKEDQDMDVDNCLVFPSKNKEDIQKHIADTLQVNEDQMIENPTVQLHSNECTRPSEVEKVVSATMQITEGGIKDQSAFDKILTNATLENESTENCTLIANNSNTGLEKVPIFIASNEKMGLSDVCPTVDAVRAFVEHLVDPVLPAKPSIRDDPPLSQQLKLAKQVHSVVLLYNYYHRIQHPELEFVAFKDFCKLIVDLRPMLSRYMKFTQKPDETDLVDMEQQLSLTEKAITGSCDICIHLDASKNVPNIEGWPVSKVAVLLVNSKKENCFLLFCSITDGVWSVIEKDVDSYNQISEVTNGINHAYKKRRVIKKPTENGLNVDDDEFVQVGYSAVKEATGINSIDIMLLESYTVYSQSKEKTASRFYIMKCSQPTTEGLIQVPIKDLIESFRGPLLKKSSSSWTVTSVLEYFHVLPYSEIISEWISRETFSNSLQDSKLVEKQSPKQDVTELYASSEGMSIGLDNKSCHDTIEALNQKEINDCDTITRCGSVKEGQDMDVDSSSVFPSKNKEECKLSVKTLQVREDQKIENPSVQHHSNECTSPIQAEKVVSTRKHITEGGIKDQSAFDKICADTPFDNETVEKCTLIANNSNIDLEKIGIFIASKGKILSQTAVNALKRKRSALALQKRVIEDEIAVCNMKIQRWLIGEEDDMDLKIDSIIEGCNVRNQGRMCQYLEGQCLPPSVKSKRLAEAVLTLQSPCEELDEICHANNWIVPTYGVSPSNGAFQANVSVKGMDFEYLCDGNPCSFPREARNSAAAQMLTKLRSMAKSAL